MPITIDCALPACSIFIKVAYVSGINSTPFAGEYHVGPRRDGRDEATLREGFHSL